jgi:hypothetical protein
MDSDGDGSLTREEARAAKQERREKMKDKHKQKRT